MTTNLPDNLKLDLTNFALQESAENGIMVYSRDEEPKKITLQVYELMEFLETIFIKYRLVHQFDYRITSESIYNSISKKNAYEQFKREDYMLPFLHHLAIQEMELSAEYLQDFILSFLKKHSHLLSIHDVVILKSGSTRAVTNVRFAVDALRKEFLIENMSVKHERSVSPTILGMLTLIFLKLNENTSNGEDTQLLIRNYKMFKKSIDNWQAPWMLCKSPENIINLLNNFLTTSKKINDKERIINLAKEFYDFISTCITIDYNSGKLVLKPDFQKSFVSFINSEAYNWNHSEAIKALRNGYKKLWGI